MANLRVRGVSAGPTTAKLRVRAVSAGGPVVNVAKLRVRQVSVSGTPVLNGSVLRVQRVAVSGPALNPANARLRVFEVDVSGPKLGILTASTLTPESGAAVSLSYSGDAGLPVTWRLVSSTNGIPAPVIVDVGFSATVIVPAVVASSSLTIGARQGTGPEQTVALTVAPAMVLRRRAGAVIPVSVHVQRASPASSTDPDVPIGTP